MGDMKASIKAQIEHAPRVGAAVVASTEKGVVVGYEVHEGTLVALVEFGDQIEFVPAYELTRVG